MNRYALQSIESRNEQIFPFDERERERENVSRDGETEASTSVNAERGTNKFFRATESNAERKEGRRWPTSGSKKKLKKKKRNLPPFCKLQIRRYVCMYVCIAWGAAMRNLWSNYSRLSAIVGQDQSKKKYKKKEGSNRLNETNLLDLIKTENAVNLRCQ